jgi:hypothetical protein
MVLFVFVALVVTACGGESTEDGGDDGGDQPTATQPADDGGDQPTATQPADDGGDNDSGSEDQAPPATEAGDDDSGGEGPSTATVTIGDETYEFSSEGALVAQCLPDLFGIMAVIIPLADGGDGGIEIIALHEGTDPAEVEQTNSVLVKIGDGRWIADPEDVNFNGDPDLAALSGVESVEVDGNTLRGTASFVRRDNTTQEWVSMTGTFEATCGDERLS